MVKYRKIMGKVRGASWVNVHVNVRWDRNGKRKIRYDKRKGKEKKKENRTQQRVRNNRYLNEQTIKNTYPLPLISEILDKLQGS